MANPGAKFNIDSVLSFGDDMLGVLRNKKDGDGMIQSFEGAKFLLSSSRSDVQEIMKSLQDHEKYVQECKEKIEKLRNETIFDGELDRLQHELDDKLQEESDLRQELRVIADELIGLERQRISIEERRKKIVEVERLQKQAQDLLSLCASVTNIIPDLEDNSKISGCHSDIVDKNKRKVEKFEFTKTESEMEVCNKLWNMG